MGHFNFSLNDFIIPGFSQPNSLQAISNALTSIPFMLDGGLPIHTSTTEIDIYPKTGLIKLLNGINY